MERLLAQFAQHKKGEKEPLSYRWGAIVLRTIDPAYAFCLVPRAPRIAQNDGTSKGKIMALKTSCDVCGRTFTGVLSSLKKINGKYMCSTCAANPTGTAQYYCSSCGTYFPSAGKKGNGWIELILYLCYIIPGIIYSIWRRAGNSTACPKCKSSSIISADSGTHVKCPDCKELVLRDARKCKHCGCALTPQ